MPLQKGLACSEACEKEASEVNQIIEKSKQIYSIGKKSNYPSTGVLFHLFFGLMFSIFGFYPITQEQNPEWFSVVMGIGFLMFGVITYVRTRKLNINC